MVTKFITLLQEPFPQKGDLKEIVKYALFLGLSVVFILMVFRPFGFSEPAYSEVVKYAIFFGAIAFGVIVIVECFQKYILKIRKDHPSWTFRKWSLNNIGIIIWISIANYFFTVYSYSLPHSLNHFFLILGNTLAIGIFPIALIGLLILVQGAQKYEKIASEISVSRSSKTQNGPPKLVRLPIHHSEQFFEIDPQQIICIEAMQNYVQIYYNQDGEIIKKVIRNTISSIEQALLSTDIQRSHRSYLVNTARIENISGNAQGLKLEINPSPGFWVPVSRKYIPTFRKVA